MLYTELHCNNMLTEQLHSQICSIMSRYHLVTQNAICSGCHIEYGCADLKHMPVSENHSMHEEGSRFLDLILHEGLSASSAFMSH
jgi:hypothetical protein